MNTQSMTAPIQEYLDALRHNLAEAQELLGEYSDDARKKISASATRTRKSIRAHPYQALALAFGVGVLLGALVSVRR